jgi:hypothetical protein
MGVDVLDRRHEALQTMRVRQNGKRAMNTNGLAKLYDRLQPWERVPLWLAAGARDDEAEQEVLARSAPRKAFDVADSYGLLQALHIAAARYMMLQLDLAGWFWFAFGTLATELENDGPQWQALRMVAFDFASNANLWQRFCADAGIDPDLLIKDCPGFATIKRTEEAARLEAFTAEEAVAYLCRIREAAGRSEAAGVRASAADRVYRMRPVEDQAKEMRAIIDRLAKHWQ